ncbi:MAG: MGMT family protein [Myxococcota bacterium]
MASEIRARIYDVVARIPRGRVATYGQIAELAKVGGHARQVGYALHALGGDSPLPWHRVVNAAGRVSPRDDPADEAFQRALLEDEGLRFSPAGRLDLAAVRWKPRGRRVQSSGA